MTTTTLLSQRAPPRCCGGGLAWKALLDTGWHGFPVSAATSVAGGAPRVPASPGASHGREEGGGSDPPLFGRWCGTGERSPAHTVAHGKHSPRGGRSLHSDPWREGGRADEEAEAAASTTGGALCARDSDSGSNNANAVRVETGTVTQHCTGDVQQPVGHRT